MLMLLRITVGWHFLYSGLWKLDQEEFSSAGFLGQAKGPWVEKFHQLIPDYHGLERLDADRNIEAINSYAASFAQHYKLNDEQKSRKDELVEQATTGVKRYLAGLAEEIRLYTAEVERLSEKRRAPDAMVAHNQKRNWEKQQELQAEVKPWLDEVAQIHADLKAELEGLLTDSQRLAGDIPKPIHQMISMDRFIIYTNIAIGACLILGLFTRLSAIGGGLFLALVVAAQPDWPGLYPPPHPSAGQSLVVTKEFVEMMALFALATLPVGRWGGLDFLVHHLITRPLFGGKES